MRAVRKGLLQIVFVALDDGRIFVRETQGVFSIQLPQVLSAFLGGFLALVNGLTAAARATAGHAMISTKS